ncbi:MAG: hypothetical protein LLG05_09800 [Porphyromonadaceae bacterium]|nr:hypothetical protein [Porphyromonadaceae bacterium]
MKKIILLICAIILLVIVLNYNGNILFKGQEVPAWIEKVTPNKGEYKMAPLKVCSLFAIAYRDGDGVTVHGFFTEKEDGQIFPKWWRKDIIRLRSGSVVCITDGENLTITGAPTRIIGHF